ncbi:MAG: hypothetical protein JJ992_01075, partial [Planctomycetes bacterium]|nr:hypothetical protein [Planctomycetota bacterium]
MWKDRLVSIDALQQVLQRQPLSQWLSAAELQRLPEMPSDERRLRWLGGRWVAKQLLQELLGDAIQSPSALHIESRDALGR